ncbi:MAG: hypothetical protein ACE37K_15695 [Planctomycetota bacterium]
MTPAIGHAIARPAATGIASLIEVPEPVSWLGHFESGSKVSARWQVRNTAATPVDIAAVDVRCRCGLEVTAVNADAPARRDAIARIPVGGSIELVATGFASKSWRNKRIEIAITAESGSVLDHASLCLVVERCPWVRPVEGVIALETDGCGFGGVLHLETGARVRCSIAALPAGVEAFLDQSLASFTQTHDALRVILWEREMRVDQAQLDNCVLNLEDPKSGRVWPVHIPVVRSCWRGSRATRPAGIAQSQMLPIPLEMQR